MTYQSSSSAVSYGNTVKYKVRHFIQEERNFSSTTLWDCKPCNEQLGDIVKSKKKFLYSYN